MNDEIVNEYYLIIKNKISHLSFNEALRSCEKLILNFPNNPNGYYYKGVCMFAMEKYEPAMDAYLKAISIDITHAKAYFNSAVIYYMQNDYDNALINIGKSLILFSKKKELDCRKRCIDALNFIQTQRKSFN